MHCQKNWIITKVHKNGTCTLQPIINKGYKLEIQAETVIVTHKQANEITQLYYDTT